MYLIDRKLVRNQVRRIPNLESLVKSTLKETVLRQTWDPISDRVYDLLLNEVWNLSYRGRGVPVNLKRKVNTQSYIEVRTRVTKVVGGHLFHLVWVKVREPTTDGIWEMVRNQIDENAFGYC